MRILLIIPSILFSLNLKANFGLFKGCGEYEISGKVVRDKKEIIKILVHENSNSEHHISIDPNDWALASGFLDREVYLNGTIIKADGTKLNAINLNNFKSRFPNPLELKGSTGFKLLKSSECK